MVDGIDISTLEVEPGQIIVMQYDIDEVDLEQANDTYKMLEANFSSNKVVGVPKGVYISSISKSQFLEWINFLKDQYDNPLTIVEEE